MTTATATISPTDYRWYDSHSDEALATIIERYTAQSAAMAGHPMADEAMAIANAAWEQQVRRGL